MKKNFSLQIFLFLVLTVLISDNIFAQKVLEHNALTVSNGKNAEAINLDPLSECTGPGQMIFDDGAYENGYGWLNTVTDGRFVSLFTPPAYPWQFNTLCIPFTRNGTATDFTFDIVVYDGTGGGTPGTLIATIPGLTAAAVPTWPSFAFYEYNISSVPSLASGSYYIGIKFNPSLYQNFYSMADQSASTPLHTGYGYDGTGWYTLPAIFSSARALGYRTLGPAVGPGLATGPNPANFATGAAALSLNLGWINAGGATSIKVFFGTDPGTMSQLYSGSPITSIAAPTPLLYTTFYFWRVDEISAGGTTYGTQWCFTTMDNPTPLTLPYVQTFDGASFPSKWSQTGDASYPWVISATNISGGTANEMYKRWSSYNGITRLIVGPISTTGLSAINLDFKTYLEDYDVGITAKIQSSTDAVNWTDEAWIWTSGSGNVGPGTINTTVTHNLGSVTYVAWVLDGDHFQFNYWYVDDVNMVSPSGAPVFHITPTSKDYGYNALNTPSDNQIFTISNNGGGTLTITAGNISITGVNANQFVLTDGNTYPINLTTGQTATVQVKFAPTSGGLKSANLQIIDNTTEATHTIPLSGRGIAVPYSENFEGFIVGQQVACQDPINWTTWSQLPCNVTEDPYISSTYAHSGTKSAKIVFNNDLVRPLASRTTGKWTISFWIYIPTGKAGYFNTLTGYTPNVFQWGLECYFNAGGGGQILEADTVDFTWQENTWQQVKVIVDLDALTPQAEFWFGATPVQIATWDWTRGGTFTKRIDGNDFFGATANDEMYMDDYSITAATTSFPLSVAISSGWNMVSVPGTNPDGMDITHWWINHTGTVYKFVPGSGYTGITNTIPGQGYWEKNTVNQTYNTGDEWPAGGIQQVTHDPLNASAGWNMFGGYEDIINSTSLTTTPPGQIVFPIYKFVPGTGYQSATQIVPGYGYWVKVSSTCTITIPDVIAKDNPIASEYIKDEWGRITITDAAGSSYTLYGVNGSVDLNQYELPPLPPAGIFDIRYGSGRIAENLSTTQSIEMRGITYPVRVRAENIDITIQDEAGTIIKTSVKSGEEIVISNPTVNKLMLTGTSVPTEYSLDQNYPNPFNPATTIKFSIPEAANVTLSIYNMLGQKVGELVNGKLEAGRYTYQWNAKNVATGMYIYELRTEKFVSVKKMLLLK